MSTNIKFYLEFDKEYLSSNKDLFNEEVFVGDISDIPGNFLLNVFGFEERYDYCPILNLWELKEFCRNIILGNNGNYFITIDHEPVFFFKKISKMIEFLGSSSREQLLNENPSSSFCIEEILDFVREVNDYVEINIRPLSSGLADFLQFKG